MSKPHHPFDHLFKAAFQVSEIAIAYFREFLPAYILEKLDLSKLYLDTTDYISPKLKEYFSDVIYKCLYILQKLRILLKRSLL